MGALTDLNSNVFVFSCANMKSIQRTKLFDYNVIAESPIMDRLRGRFDGGSSNTVFKPLLD